MQGKRGEFCREASREEAIRKATSETGRDRDAETGRGLVCLISLTSTDQFQFNTSNTGTLLKANVRGKRLSLPPAIFQGRKILKVENS